MAHDAGNDAISIIGGSLKIELPIRGLKTIDSSDPNRFIAFGGLTENESITKTVLTNASGVVINEYIASEIASWKVEIFFEHSETRK
jgi:hypothetical protein